MAVRERLCLKSDRSSRLARPPTTGKIQNPQISASLFGVGAPEALVIGVVALLVFGPKGLAEIAKQLGSTLRAFQPTIRELQDVSREFKETLEDEIGLDDIRNPTPTPRQAPAANQAAAPAAADEANKAEVTEAMRKAAAEAAWGAAEPPPPAQPEAPAEPVAVPAEAEPAEDAPAAPAEVPADLAAEEGEAPPKA